jgi:hypothetical protein
MRGEQSFDQFDAGQALGGERLRGSVSGAVIIGGEIGTRGIAAAATSHEAGDSRRERLP